MIHLQEGDTNLVLLPLTEREIILSKKLAFVLRHAAESEGLVLDEEGWASLKSLMQLPRMRKFSETDVKRVVQYSVSTRNGKPRYELEVTKDDAKIRATYGKTTGQPASAGDESDRNQALQKLRREDKLNNKHLRELLDDSVHTLDLSRMVCTEATLRLITQRCSRLTSLNLTGNSILNDHLTGMLAKKSCAHLTHLTLGGCTNITDTAIQKLVAACPKLVALSLYDCSQLGDAAVAAVGQLTEVQCLNLHGLRGLTDGGLTRLPGSLSSLDLTHCSAITDKAVHAVAQQCPLLVNLNLYGCSLVTADSLEAVILNCNRLQTLTVKGCNVDAGALYGQVQKRKNRDLEAKVRELERQVRALESENHQLWGKLQENAKRQCLPEEEEGVSVNAPMPMPAPTEEAAPTSADLYDSDTDSISSDMSFEIIG